MNLWNRLTGDRAGIPVKEVGSRRVGVELEMEFRGEPSWPRSQFWRNEEDGSLRHGREFVLRSPTPLDKLGDPMRELERLLAGLDCRVSSRTSTHVHVDIRDLSIQEYSQAMAAWYIVEAGLLPRLPPHRRGNPFCVPGKLSQEQIRLFVDFTRATRGTFPGREQFRYASLNLSATTKFGSLEARVFPGSVHIPEINRWTQMVAGTIHFGSRIPVADQIDLAQETPERYCEALGIDPGTLDLDALPTGTLHILPLLNVTTPRTRPLVLAERDDPVENEVLQARPRRGRNPTAANLEELIATMHEMPQGGPAVDDQIAPEPDLDDDF